jgi:SagB-type dehydrogenase family enzyme
LSTAEATESLSPADIALGYHARTKHSLERYAAGPETLDWDAQPNPFREFAGAPRVALPLVADRLETTWAQLLAPDRVPAPLTIESVATLLELSMGLSAWKEQGPDRWALRCNPSSGNLHPTEAYVVASHVGGLDDGLYHYVSRDHALEQRCRVNVSAPRPARLWVGLASVHWREAWKYGERAFRYCQLDVGHALGALRFAAAALGWSATVVEDVADTRLAALMGLDRAADFAGVEHEEADLLIAIDLQPTPPRERDATARIAELRAGDWTGRANRLDPHPMYRWPVMDDVSVATRGGGTGSHHEEFSYPPLRQSSQSRAGHIILQRRSAQRFDSKFVMPPDDFYHLLDCLLPRPLPPWDVLSFSPRLHPIFFVHRVEGLEPGLYALPRRPDAIRALRDAMRTDFVWQTVEGAPAHLPFFKLVSADCRAMARTVSCHQWIASDGCFALGTLSEFEPIVRTNAWRYRQLHWEAGLLGHVLYLEAEAAGLRGTGIGCYFDDAVHGLLGMTDTRFQVLYHFTVGRPRDDTRIMTLPAYPGRPPRPTDGASP